MAQWESVGKPFRAEWGKFAWWWLTKNQKAKLKEQRAAGRFGGSVPRKPEYWRLHDTGMPSVGIQATRYFQKAKPEIRELVKRAVDTAIRRNARGNY